MADSPAHLPDKSWLETPGLRAVFNALANEGETRAVGGCVRNALLGEPIGDVDLATTLRPKDVIACAEAAGLRAVPTGLDHGTVTVIAAGTGYEVTTLRADAETHGRHATVAFHSDWEADAGRRDFTMNALYASRDGTLHDPLRGYADLMARQVRFIGDPVARIREDYLRILRFFRFFAWYGKGAPDEAALKACHAERAGLRNLSRERIGMEVIRVLAAPDPVMALSAMAGAGVSASVFDGDTEPAGVGRLVALERATGRAPDPLLRLAALLGAEVNANILQERLRLSRDQTEQLKGLADHHFKAIPNRRMIERAVLNRGNRAAADLLLLSWVFSGETPEHRCWRSAFEIARDWQAPHFPLTGDDLIRAGMSPGPQVGEALWKAKEAWIESGYTLVREELLSLR